jgi:hypothetical protein
VTIDAAVTLAATMAARIHTPARNAAGIEFGEYDMAVLLSMSAGQGPHGLHDAEHDTGAM